MLYIIYSCHDYLVVKPDDQYQQTGKTTCQLVPIKGCMCMYVIKVYDTKHEREKSGKEGGERRQPPSAEGLPGREPQGQTSKHRR